MRRFSVRDMPEFLIVPLIVVACFLPELSVEWSALLTTTHHSGTTRPQPLPRPQPQKYNRCALVSSGGTMLRAEFSKIEQHYDATVRMNTAPVVGFEEDVGRRTTVRSVPNLEDPALKTKLISYSDADVLLTRHIGARSLEAVRNATSRGKLLEVYQIMEPNVKIKLPARLTTGFWTITALRYFCVSVFLVGFNSPGEASADVRYHYWEEAPSYKQHAQQSLLMSAGHDFNFEHELYSNISTTSVVGGKLLVQEISWHKFDRLVISHEPNYLVTAVPVCINSELECRL